MVKKTKDGLCLNSEAAKAFGVKVKLFLLC